jgi:nucleoside-diphosphate-sugar epimerase
MCSIALPIQDLDDALCVGAGMWEKLRNGRVFVTGGTGFFGIWLLETFVRANRRFNLCASLFVLTRDRKAFQARVPHLIACQEIRVVCGDLDGFTFPEGVFTHVIHAATDSDLCHTNSSSNQVSETILRGTDRILEFAASAGTNRMLFVSSGAVYGAARPNSGFLTEDDALLPCTPYGEGKRDSEELAIGSGTRNGFEVKIARCFSFLGPHLPLKGNFAMGNFIRDALGHQAISITGDGSAVRSYLYCSDLVRWLWSILFEASHGRPYNVGSSDPITLKEAARIVSESSHQGGHISITKKTVGLGSNSIYVPSVRRAELELGLMQTVAFPAAVKKTLEWYSDQIQ